jgi:hypothetical protein
MSIRNNLDSTTQAGTVVGLFKNQVDAERAIDRLKQAGFSESQIGVAMRDRSQQQELVEGTGTQAAEGAATGAVSGGVLGGVIGLLAGVGALAIPGVGPIIAGGAPRPWPEPASERRRADSSALLWEWEYRRKMRVTLTRGSGQAAHW